MEKRVPHYPLKEIKRQMQTVPDMNLAKAARSGLRLLAISEQEGAWCDNCDECITTGTESQTTSPQLRAFIAQVEEQERKLLQRVRKKLGLTQRQAAALTGGGQNAFSRYERGEAQPLPAVINLFKLLDKYPELLKELAA